MAKYAQRTNVEKPEGVLVIVLDAVVGHGLIRIAPAPPLILLLNNHVVLVEEVNVVILQGVHSYTVVCGMQ